MLLIFAFAMKSYSQIIVKSTDGYSVEITINPTSIYLYSSDCTNGYNYDINFDYTIKMTGSNIPSGGLWTLQGTIETADGSAFFDIPNTSSSGSAVTGGHIWTSKTDCKTATLGTAKIKIITIQIQGSGIPDQYITYTNSTPLPIELVSFEAKKESGGVYLSWKTATETNNDYFTIESSTNGVDFSSVANIKGAGNSNQMLTYSYSDINVETIGVYYRLKQTDYDGKYSYSSMVYVAAPQMEAGNILVFPNPSETNQIMFNSTSPDLYLLTIFSFSGQVLQNMDLASNQITLPELAKGLYFLQFKNKTSGEIQNIKYIQK